MNNRRQPRPQFLPNATSFWPLAVTFVAVHFDGYGDDGTTEEVKCYAGDWFGSDEHEPVKHDASGLQEHFEALVPFGYENDCGGFGDVVLDVRAAS